MDKVKLMHQLEGMKKLRLTKFVILMYITEENEQLKFKMNCLEEETKSKTNLLEEENKNLKKGLQILSIVESTTLFHKI